MENQVLLFYGNDEFLVSSNVKKAVDVACDGAYAYQVLSAAMRAGFTGIGIQQNGVSRFIHLDYIRPGDGFHVLRPVVWSY